MDNNKAADLTNDFFKAKPSLKSLFVTSDGQVFENRNYAFQHAKSLDSKTPEVTEVANGAAPVAETPVVNLNTESEADES